MRRRAALVPGTEPLSISHEPRRVKGNASDRCSVANSTGVLRRGGVTSVGISESESATMGAVSTTPRLVVDRGVAGEAHDRLTLVQP